MPTEHTFRIDFHITQQGLDLGGTQEIVDSSQMQVDITQQGMHITATQDIYPTIDDFITFGKWYKGDKGDKGDPGVGIPQNLSISGYDLSISSGNTVHLPEPSIPTVNDGILTIKKNGTTIDTFSANESSDKTVDIQVPTSLSDLSDLFLDNVQNQQVLRYDSSTGKWVNADVSESNGVVFVKFTSEEIGGETVISCDTSIADIVEAIDSGKMVYGETQYPYLGNIKLPLFSYLNEEGSDRMVLFLSSIGNAIFILLQGIQEYIDEEWGEDTWVADEHEFVLSDISDVDAPDPQDGQVLTYDGEEGMWKPSDVNIKAKTGTTAYWNSRVGYIPEDGEIIVYTDYSSKVVNNETVYIPGVKIGSGNGYVQDLAFVSEDIAESLLAHTGNTNIHVTSEDKTKWDNKLNVDDNQEVIGETLIFNRN